MEDIKKFIDNNRAAFETEELPKTHRVRFNQQLHRLRYRPLLRKTIGIAASVTLLVGTAFFMRTVHTDPMAQIDAEIALYGVTATEISNEIMTLCRTNGSDSDEIQLIIDQVHNDAIPIFKQLPEELSATEKAYILKRYYNQKLKALRQIYAQVENTEE